MQILRRDSDDLTLKRIRENDRSVLGELFNRYKRMIYSYVNNHGGNDRDAEDILQETIIVLWQKVNRSEFTLTAKLGTFMMAVAKNKWMAELRKQKRVVPQDIPETVENGNPSSLQKLLSDEQQDIIHRALDRIQPVCRKILLLYYFEEKPMAEIAKILGFANPKVVKSKKYQCKKSLEELVRKQLNELEGERP